MWARPRNDSSSKQSSSPITRILTYKRMSHRLRLKLHRPRRAQRPMRKPGTPSPITRGALLASITPRMSNRRTRRLPRNAPCGDASFAYRNSRVSFPCLVILPLYALGGRLMVRLQTLDLRIGVRVPASQPLIPKHFLKIS